MCPVFSFQMPISKQKNPINTVAMQDSCVGAAVPGKTAPTQDEDTEKTATSHFSDARLRAEEN